jgi:channel protein, hemolysin III family
VVIFTSVHVRTDFIKKGMNIMTKKIMKAKDPGSALSHFVGMLMALFSALPLLIKASKSPDFIHFISLGIFALSMILLYTASTVYHTFDLSDKINRRLKKFDHMMIFILIAGTYTPICLIVLNGKTGIVLLTLIWGMALLGICLKAFWVYCPKWVSSVIYIAMGWTCVLAFTPLLHSLSHTAFLWLLFGGIIYTVGGVIYALKLPIFNSKHQYFGSHEIFHLFCLGGSACHFILMYYFVAAMPL